MFHFALLAHAIGIRKSEDQCVPPAQPVNGVCPAGTDNVDYKTPRSISGMGDFPGGDLLETLGLWGNGFKGSDFVQASTVMHELGHNFWLTHTGDLFTAPPNFEDNCNSEYLSVMNYLFQIPGLTPDPPTTPPSTTSASAQARRSTTRAESASIAEREQSAGRNGSDALSERLVRAAVRCASVIADDGRKETLQWHGAKRC